jgi:hypothetical protein
MNEEFEDIEKLIESFERVERITDIILLGENGGIRRIELEDD